MLVHRQQLVQLRATSGPFLSDTESNLINHVEACVRRRATAKRTQVQSARQTPTMNRVSGTGSLQRTSSSTVMSVTATSQDDESGWIPAHKVQVGNVKSQVWLLMQWTAMAFTPYTFHH
jgi:hypothetical protein